MRQTRKVQTIIKKTLNSAYGDVVEKFGHVFDDVTVLRRLSLQEFLDHHDTLCDHGFYGNRKCTNILNYNILVESLW